MKIERKNGYIFLTIENAKERGNEGDAEAWNFTRGIHGDGDDTKEWVNAGDLWGYLQELYILEEGGYGIIMADDQFTGKELEEIETKRR